MNDDTINFDTNLIGIDEAIEKAQRLKALLTEAQQLIAELNEMNISLDIT